MLTTARLQFHGVQIPLMFSGHSNLVKKQLMTGYADSSAFARVKNAYQYRRSQQNHGEFDPIHKAVRSFIRQELRAVLDELDSIESQHPILSGNPKLPVLQQDDKADEVE
ncbi:MAG: hypothetical protein OXI16_11360 [Chloroflexota bacterium]|nr:hypothetical protein [Chloroflexota bacterium]